MDASLHLSKVFVSVVKVTLADRFRIGAASGEQHGGAIKKLALFM
jgi:hypothetical protein